MSDRTPEQRAEDVDNILAACREITQFNKHGQLTGAWQYLESRGIDPSNLPPSIRCQPGALKKNGSNGALVGILTDDDDCQFGVTRTFITKDGRKVPGAKPPKQTNAVEGWLGKACVRMPCTNRAKWGNFVAVCEGDVTGLSAWQATGIDVRVSCGVQYLGAVPLPDGCPVILLKEGDEPDSTAAVEFNKAVIKLKRRGHAIFVAEAPPGQDANDVLREQGPEAVYKMIDERVPFVFKNVASEPAAKDGRPRIMWEESEFPLILDQVEKIFVEKDVPLYQSKGRLLQTCRLDVEDVKEPEESISRQPDALVMREVGPARLIEFMTSTINFRETVVTKNDAKIIPIAAPPMLATHYLARQDKWRLPVLTGLVETPTLRADGTLITEEGYDRQSRLLYDANGVIFPPIPENPTLEEAKAAINLIKEPLCDFPFVDAPARSVALSGILTGLTRPAMSAAPVHAIDAPMISTGKSLLADVIALIATGRAAAVMPLPASEEEAIKVWLAILRTGDRVVAIDNVDRPVGGATMCSVTTQISFQARLLGVSEMIQVPTNVTILCNGNNIVFEADMSSRAIVARMDSGLEHPDERTFRYDLRTYIPEHRPEIVAAALTVLRGYIAAGRPFTATPSRFPDWDRLVRGALIWCGEADPQITRLAVDAADPARSDLGTLIAAMVKCFGPGCKNQRPSSQEILERSLNQDDDGRAISEALCAFLDKGGRLSTRVVTVMLKRHVGTIVDGYCMQRYAGNHDKGTRWRVMTAGAKPEPEQGRLV